VGSTSTLTKSLSQVYFALSGASIDFNPLTRASLQCPGTSLFVPGGKGVDISSLSQDFGSEVSSDTTSQTDPQRTDFTAGASLPAAIVIGPLSDGLYYVDSDKSYDSENVLSDFVRVSDLAPPAWTGHVTTEPTEAEPADARAGQNTREAPHDRDRRLQPLSPYSTGERGTAGREDRARGVPVPKGRLATHAVSVGLS
jgi:hypothetical protein